ncbi:S66 peptidase family protein [Haloimpatiens sp. FM7315]|uniref:S66 family peptidase n=1 Tax=Haloimpatiens sp. FM7315 TaxID=3298609 RepID=UPI0035A2D0A6
MDFKKLNMGDEIRVISPSRSMKIVSKDVREGAINNFSKMGLKVTFSKYVEECDEFFSSSIESRVQDIHEAFLDKNVKAVITTLGGYNSNQLLRYIDFEIIKNNPKIFCGYSDITALCLAIYKKTGLNTFYGPHFSSFGMKKGNEYTKKYFLKTLFNVEGEVNENKDFNIDIKPSEYWSDDPWYKNQEDREFIENKGYICINKGKAEGTLIGGNLCTMNLLQGTEYMPSLENSILFIEDDELVSPEIFDRDLQSTIHQPGFHGVKGIIIGRFQKATAMTEEKLVKIIKSKKELKGIPVMANVNFGHATPIATIPVGGWCSMDACSKEISIRLK